MKNYIFLSIWLFSLFGSVIAEPSKHTVAPEQGYNPDARTAIKIAEAVWLPIYGKAIYEKSPFAAKLQGEVWLVEGTSPDDKVGGVLVAAISKESGQIIRISHGK